MTKQKEKDQEIFTKVLYRKEIEKEQKSEIKKLSKLEGVGEHVSQLKNYLKKHSKIKKNG